MKKISHHIKRIREKPEEERRHILHLLIMVLGVIVILLWIYSLGKSVSNPDTKIKIKKDLQPFSVLKDNIVDGYKGVSTQNSN